MIPRHTNNTVVEFLTIVEAKCSLISVPMIISCYFYPSASITHFVSLFQRRTRLLPHTLQFQLSLLSPYMWYSRFRMPPHLQTYLKYRMSCDILVDGVLAADDVRLELLQAWCLHQNFQKRIFLNNLYIAFWMYLPQPVGHPVVETLQVLTDPVGNHPCIWVAQNCHFHDQFVEHPRGPGIWSLPDQYPENLCPRLLGLLKFWDGLWKIIVWHVQDPPNCI